MRKYIWVFLFLLGSVSAAAAQPQLDIGQNDNKQELTLMDAVDSLKEEKESVSADKEDEDKGIFSFMNFSFGKKKEAPKVKARPNEGKESFVERVTRQAEEGDVNSQLTLGYMYLYGENGVSKDYEKAFRYYSMAAAQNDSIAVNNVGSLYYSGIGTEKNYLKAAAMFDRAAKLGNIEASVNLAFIYLSGENVGKNSRAAMELFKQAARKDNPTAKFMLGYAYYKGFVVPKDYKKAVSLIREAANVHYDDAEYVLALMYLNGDGITKNYGNAVRFLKMAINQGHVEAMTQLGDILATGSAFPKDIYRAHVLFNIAAVRGAPKAAEKRDALEKVMKIDELLQAQAEAEKYAEHPTELTNYINQTFGRTVRHYVDDNMRKAVASAKGSGK